MNEPARRGGVHEGEVQRAPAGLPTDLPDAPPKWYDVDEPASAGDDGSHRSFFAELPFLVLVAFVLALLLKTFLVQAFYIPSESMVPTLERGDRVLVNKVVYHLREPRRGDVVVFSQDSGVPAPPPDPNAVRRFLRSLSAGLGLVQAGERDFIKRVIGLPGDEIAMRDGVVYVNGEPLPEAPADEGGYLSTRDVTEFGPTTVPPGHYFVMGDNRPNSADSRTLLGPIPADTIVGRAFIVIWPPERLDVLQTPGYGALSRASRASPPEVATRLPLAA